MWQWIAVPKYSISWFLGSLFSFNREPKAEVRFKSWPEPKSTSKVDT